MPRVLFVDKNDYKDKLGIYYLAAVLKEAGHRVDYCEVGRDDIERYFRRQVDFVLYSVMSYEYAWFKEFNRRLKKKFKFKAVVGGPHFNASPESGIRDKNVDFVVQGPGEVVIKDIVDGKIGKKLVAGIIPDVNMLPQPERGIVYKYRPFRNAHLKRFIAGRDCPYNCSYCHNHILHKVLREQKDKFFQRLHPDKLIDDVLDVRKRYGLGVAVFNDDDFAADAEWLHSFCKRWQKRKVNVPFTCYINVVTVSDDSLKLLAKTGLSLASIGVESADPVVRKEILNRVVTSNGRIEHVVGKCMSLGIKVKTLNMIGLPVGDPLKDALETLRFNQKLNPANSSCSILEPFPNTKIYEYCISRGFLKRHVPYVDVRHRTILNIRDAKKINILCKWWNIFVTGQMPQAWIDLLLEMPLPRDLSRKMLALSNSDANALYEEA